MAKVLQHRRGTTAEHANFTGAAGEVTVDTTDKRLVVHDGSTKGGVPAAKKSEIVDAKSELQQLIAEELKKYLPLAGGTMTGSIQVPAVAYAKSGYAIGGDGVGEVRVTGGTTDGSVNGASLNLYPENLENPNGHEGGFVLATKKGDKESFLTCLPDGTLTFNDMSVLNPVGTVIAMASNSAPSGYVLCNGAEVSRTTYANLFNVIGTTYGSGNGSTTFNLPNLIDKFIQGSGTAGNVKNAGLPNVDGDFYFIGMHDDNTGNTAPFTVRASFGPYTSGGNYSPAPLFANAMNFNASRCNQIYGSSDTVQPPALTMRFYIKY